MQTQIQFSQYEIKTLVNFTGKGGGLVELLTEPDSHSFHGDMNMCVDNLYNILKIFEQ